MKKLFITFIAFSLMNTMTFCQKTTDKASVIWGAEYEDAKKATLSDIFGYDETGVYALKSENKFYDKSPSIEHYDENMNLLKSVKLELTEEGKKKDFENIIQFNKKLYLFSSFKNQKLDKNFLFVQTIDKTTLLPNKDILKIAEINYSGKSKYNSGAFNCIISPDSSKLLVYYDLPYEKGTSEKYGFQAYDINMKLLWQKEISLPYKEELFTVERYRVDNSGNAYILGRIYKDKKREKRKGEPNYQYQVISYTDNGNSINEYPVKIEGKFITDMQITINDNLDIVCAGFFSDEGTFSIKGCYYLSIDGKTKEIKNKSFKDFGIDFLTQNLSEKKSEKIEKKMEKGKDVELFDYDLRDIILRDDGGAVLTAEQYYSTTTTYTTTSSTGSVTTHTTTTYHYNDIIVINISPEGNIDWAQKIAKVQSTTEDMGFYSSFAMTIVKDKLYFIFNDNPKNLFAQTPGKVSNMILNKECIVALVTIDSKGDQTREALFKSADAEVVVRPKVCEQVSGNELVIFGQKKKAHRLAKVTFK
jgi:hypothetical protein